MANMFEKMRNSISSKILLVGVLVLILLIPMKMVESLISERSYVYHTTEADITGSWGKEIMLINPVLTINESTSLSFTDEGAYVYLSQYKHLNPEKLSIKGHIETQLRARGIYKVPVYSGRITLKGYFTLPEPEVQTLNTSLNARLQVLLNVRALKSPPEFFWNGEQLALTPEKGETTDQLTVFSVPLGKLANDPLQVHPFELTLDLNGSTTLSFVSRAKESDIHLTSNWNSPGFFGTTLPVSHDITDTGFRADWQTNNFFADLGHEDGEIIAADWFQTDASFGVKFVQTVDTYQLVTRATKHGILFLTLVFAVYLLYEILGNIPLHPVQYLFIGFSNCIFYLLLLSLAEHIAFNMAYFSSATASTLLVSLYGMSILKNRLRGVLICVKLSVLYGFLYTTLTSEDYALLIGSIGLFTMLALIMYFTRNFNWYRTAGVAA